MPFVHRVDARLLRPVECPGLRRLGSPHDGGYVVPEITLRKARVLLSFGLSVDWRFERDALALNPGLAIRAYDHTVGPRRFRTAALKSSFSVPLRLIGGSPRGSRASLAKLRNALDYFRFFRGRVQHLQQRVWYNADRGSAAIAEILATAGSDAPQSIFAKIDIEGSEYRILPALIERAELFSGMAIEFHDTDICATVFNEQMAALREHFEVAHVHANNYGDMSVDHALPLTWEVTLIHRALLGAPVRAYTGPLPRPGLDTPNNPAWPDHPVNLPSA